MLPFTSNSLPAGGINVFKMELGAFVFVVYLVVPAIFAEDVSCKLITQFLPTVEAGRVMSWLCLYFVPYFLDLSDVFIQFDIGQQFDQSSQ